MVKMKMKYKLFSKFLMDYNLSQTKFAEICGITRSCISGAMNKKCIGVEARGKILIGLQKVTGQKHKINDVFYQL